MKQTRAKATRPQPDERVWPADAAAWRSLVDGCLGLTVREREAMQVQFVEWPGGASNLEYLTLRKMAARLGISIVTFNRHIHSALFKLSLVSVPPRTKIPSTVKRALLDAVSADAVCDLCQKPLDRLPLQASEDGVVEYADLVAPPRFATPVSIDHILPVSQGGTHELANLRVVHAFCNLSDGARMPISRLGPAMYGYVRRSEELPNGRGPRKWIEPERHAADVVRFLMTEYSTGRHSITSLVRSLNSRRRLLPRRAVSLLLGNGKPSDQAEEVLRVLEFHSRPRSEYDLRRGYVAIVPPEVAEACARLLARRAERIRRALATREKNAAAARRSAARRRTLKSGRRSRGGTQERPRR